MRMGCPRCGSFYESDAKFCARDGSRLVEAVTAPYAIAPARPAGSRHASPPEVPGRVSPNGVPETTTAGARWVDYANLAGSLLDGRYLISRKLAEGGMSIVYMGTDNENDGARVAIKILPPELSEDMKAMERLRREADMGIRLVHPNVCSILRLGETSDGLVYVVMPFIEGEVLCDRVYRLGGIPLELAVRFASDMATGLHAAHELEIIHRDLKPENVMICRGKDGAEQAVVMDFGLAKERKAEGELQKLTATGIILGTPEFMSPEQLRGKPLDPRTDIYSLALMTYEMLTGKLPFQGRTQQEMMIARLRSDPIPIRRMRPDFDIPESVERVLNKAMSRNPDDRYQTVVEFADALAAAAGGVPAESGLLGKLFGR